MPYYQNLNGNSGVVYYETATTFIQVTFKTGATYRYSHNGPAGRANVEQMKVLAEQGRGLATFINKNVRNLYDR